MKAGQPDREMNARQREALVGIAGPGVLFDCPMGRYTTFRAGGRAEALCRVGSLADLERLMAYLGGEDIPYLVLGRGSNLLVRDGGFRGVALRLGGELAALEGKRGDARRLVAGGGAAIGDLLGYCRAAGLAGLEFLAGIPGTVGGATAMNAGAWGSETAQCIREVLMVTRGGRPETFDRSALSFSYRALALPRGAVIARVEFALALETAERVAKRTAAYLAQRRSRQPLEYPSAGSVFKNPPGDYAGRLIEEAGLKGRRIGGAMISPQHANFIVNTGGATATDILALMDLARERVRARTGVELEPEIRVAGREAP